MKVELTGWSPFVPGDADASSLPVAAVEYRFSNPTGAPVEAVFSFHARNFMKRSAQNGETPADDAVLQTKGGFVLWQPGSEEKPWEEGAFSATVDDPAPRSTAPGSAADGSIR